MGIALLLANEPVDLAPKLPRILSDSSAIGRTSASCE